MRESGFSFQIGYDDALAPIWEKALFLANTELPYDVSFYQEEWNRVVISQEAITRDQYLKASRNGRGTRLDRRKRLLVWQVLDNYQNLMSQYTHIIVDEGQDLSDNTYRLIRALAGPEHANDLFIVGDAHQRIYRNRPILSKCGINVRGRSSILKINYRTTEEIRHSPS